MAVTEEIKAWIVANYGDGTRVTTDGWRKLNVAVMNNTIAAPYTKADITEEVVLWAMNNPNYTVSGTAPVPPPATGKPGAEPTIVYSATSGCVVQLASFPGGADSGAKYWIDGYPPGTPSGIPKDYSRGEYDYLQMSCGEHLIFVSIPGFADTEEIFTLASGVLKRFVATPNLVSASTVTATTGKGVGTLAVSAKDSTSGKTVDWGVVRLRSETATTSGVYVGIVPYEGQVVAKTYNVVVTAKGYNEGVQKVAVKANQRTVVSIPLYQKKFAAVLKIMAGGPAYIDGMSFKDYEVLFVGETRKKDWVRIETTVTDTFQVVMTWYHHIEGADLAQLTRATELFGAYQGVLKTEEKVLSPYMTATERHLDFPEWGIPNKPGYYRVAFGLDIGT